MGDKDDGTRELHADDEPPTHWRVVADYHSYIDAAQALDYIRRCGPDRILFTGLSADRSRLWSEDDDDALEAIVNDAASQS